MSHLLPNGLSHPEHGWLRYIHLREMRGTEEDLLTDSQLRRDGTLFMRVLQNCITGFSTTPETPPVVEGSAASALTKRLWLADSTFTVVKLRELSLGKEFSYEAHCPACRTSARYVTLLDEQPVTYRKDDDPPKDLYSFTHESVQGEVKWRALRLEDSGQLARVRREAPNRLPTMSLYLHIESVNGEKLTSYKQLQDWPMRARNALRNDMEKQEVGFDVDVINDCPQCSASSTITLPVGNVDFFAPSGMKTF